MSVKDLDDGQQVLLVALLKAVVNVDGLLSLAEMQKMRALKAELGPEPFRRLVVLAAERYPTPEAAQAAVHALEDVAAKATILELAEQTAALDGMSPEEAALLEPPGEPLSDDHELVTAALQAIAGDAAQVDRAEAHLLARIQAEDAVEQRLELSMSWPLAGVCTIAGVDVDAAKGTYRLLGSWEDGALRWGWHQTWQGRQAPEHVEWRLRVGRLPAFASMVEMDPVPCSRESALALCRWLGARDGWLPYVSDETVPKVYAVKLTHHRGREEPERLGSACWCSVCGASRSQRDKTITGSPTAVVCDECVGLLEDIARSDEPRGLPYDAADEPADDPRPDQPACMLCSSRKRRSVVFRGAVCYACTETLVGIVADARV